MSLPLSLSTIEITVLRKKRPYLSESPADAYEFHRINLVTGSDLLKLLIFARIHHFTYQVGARCIAHDGGYPVELPAQSKFSQHVRVYKDMARGSKVRQFPHWKPIILSSNTGKEDI